MKSPTVSQELYRLLSEKEDWTASGEIETWHVFGATGSTITRKLRALCEAKYLAVRYQKGTHHAEYMALRTKAERDSYVAPEAPQSPTDLPEKPKIVGYTMTVKNGIRYAVPVIEV